MNRDRLLGNWKQLNGLLQEKWCAVRNDKAGLIDARCQRVAGKAQSLNAMAQERSVLQLKEFFSRNRKWYISH